MTQQAERSLVDGVGYAVEDHVALVSFDKPERNNAMDVVMQERYGTLLREAGPEVRAIVVTGAGRSFCPGADLGLLADIADVTDIADIADITDISVAPPAGARKDGYRDVLAAAFVPQPVVAAINGGCAGLGFVIACAADVRFAAAGAKFTTAFARRGLIAEYGIAKLLPELVGQGRARDLLLSGRTFTAEQARDYGLVQEVVPPEELLAHATAYARDLAVHSAPRSMAVMKSQFPRESALPLADAAAEATARMLESFACPELAEGLASWNERRAPAFPPYHAG